MWFCLVGLEKGLTGVLCHVFSWKQRDTSVCACDGVSLKKGALLIILQMANDHIKLWCEFAGTEFWFLTKWGGQEGKAKYIIVWYFHIPSSRFFWCKKEWILWSLLWRVLTEELDATYVHYYDEIHNSSKCIQ